MTIWKSVGKSRYRGETLGVEQFMQVHAANRVLDMIDFIATLPGCRRLTVNEGRRTRARQDSLWVRFLNGTGYLAARPYTSRHDEVTHGNAGDIGGPDGEALNDAEVAAISTHGPRFGVEFTGLTFNPPEPWHVEAEETPYTPQREEDDMTPEERKMLKAIYDGTVGTGKYTVRKDIDSIKKSQGRIERFARAVANKLGIAFPK